MQIMKPLQERLQRAKGTDRWRRISERSNVSYFTVARIARGEIKDPGCLTAERLFQAIRDTEPRRRVKAAA